MVGSFFTGAMRAVVLACALMAADDASGVTIRVEMNSGHFRRVYSNGGATCTINLNETTGDFTVLGSYESLTTRVTGIGLRVHGRRVPGLGRKPAVYSCAWDSNSTEHGNFSTGGKIPLQRIQNVLNGKAEVVIRTTRYPKGEVGGWTPRAMTAQAGLGVMGCLALCGARRRIRVPASR